MTMVLISQVCSRLFWMSVKRWISKKVWLPDADSGTAANSSNFKWITSIELDFYQTDKAASV